MTKRLRFVFRLVLLTSIVPGARGADFAHDIAPILKKHCVQCHGGREAKGSFSLNTRELLVSSGQVTPGQSSKSAMMELVTSKNDDEQMPPKDRPRLTDPEIDALRQWIDAGVQWDDGFSFTAVAFEPPLRPRRPELPQPRDGRAHPIDRILDEYLAARNAARPNPVDDATFLRRVYLDLVGLLPDPKTRSDFLADQSPDKRTRMIRDLLKSDIAYADHWLTFFNDLLRNDYSGTGFITGGRRQVSTWLYAALLNNKPFDQFTRELIAPPTPESQGYIDGIRWRGEVSAGQTVEIQFAQSISQSFLGINMKCASCHDSFIDRWKLDEAYGLAAIYSDRPLEIHRCDKPVGRTAEASWLFPEIGQVDPAAPREQRLQQLAALMTHPENGRFTRTIVNRLWYKLMGRGIVHPLDAMQSRPWNEDLLDYLAVKFRDHEFDLKHLLEFIATSEAYQSQPAYQSEGGTEAGVVQEYQYTGPIARRMTAEQFLDGVWQITGAAPASMDAAVIRAVVDSAAATAQQLKAQWIWGNTAAEGKTPAAGEAILLRKVIALSDDVERSAAVMTCDNSMTLFVNGREIQRSGDWQRPVTAILNGALKKGDNEIVVIARNEGQEPNAAACILKESSG